MIGSPCAYVSRNRRAITRVSDLNFFKLDTCNSLDTHVIFTSITCALMASLAMFSTVFKT